LKTWSSTQASIAQSSGEAEYYALVRAASEALGMQAIMRDLGWFCKIRLLVDSSAAKSIASRTGLGKLRHLEIKFLWLQECVRRGKVVLSKVRGDINPADVLTKPKSLEDMRLLLNFSCLDWCDGRVPDNFYSGGKIEFVNSVVGKSTCRDERLKLVNSVGHRSNFEDSRIRFVDSVGNSSFEDTRNGGRYYFVNSPTVRRRGVLEFEQFVSDPAPNVQTCVDTNICSVGNMLAIVKQVGFGVRGLVTLRDKRCVCTFGSRRMPWRHNQVVTCEVVLLLVFACCVLLS